MENKLTDRIYSFKDSENELGQFTDILKQFSISTIKESVLKTAIRNLRKLPEYKVIIKDNTLKNLPFEITELRPMIFLYVLIGFLVDLKGNPYFDKLEKHLKLLSETNFAQNDSTVLLSQPENEASNKCWELFLLISLLKIGAEIIYVDDPFPKKSKENKCVDIIAELDDIKWGFECKTINSSEYKPKSFLDRFQDGIKQIEESEVKRGIVCFNLRNIIDHNKFLNRNDNNYFNFFHGKDVAQELLNVDIKKNWDSFKIHIDSLFYNCDIKEDSGKISYINNEIFKNSNKISKGLINYYSTLAICLENSSICFEHVQRLNPQGLCPEDFCKEHILSCQINNGFNKKDKNYMIEEYLNEMYRNLE